MSAHAHSYWSYFMAELFWKKNNSISARGTRVTVTPCSLAPQHRPPLRAFVGTPTEPENADRLSLSALRRAPDNRPRNKGAPFSRLSTKSIPPLLSRRLGLPATKATMYNARQIIYERRHGIAHGFYTFLFGHTHT